MTSPRRRAQQLTPQLCVVLFASCLKANSHRRAGRDKTVLSVSRPLRRCVLDSRRLETVADRKFEV